MRQMNPGGGAVLRILSDGDDRMGAKIKTQKTPPKNSHAEFQTLKNFQKALNDTTRKIKTLEIKCSCMFIHHTMNGLETKISSNFIQSCPCKGQKVPLILLRAGKFFKDSTRPCRQILFPSSCRYQMVSYSCFIPAEPEMTQNSCPIR